MKSFFSTVLLLVALVPAAGATFSEPFSAEPVAWESWNGGAFRWDAGAQNLAVTWDSRETNGFFFYKLPMTLTRRDSFAVEFTLRLDDLQLGINPGKNSTFPICLGFLNMAEAKRTSYFRGSGVNAATGPRSIVEFTYFADSGFGATIGTVIASTNNQMAYSHTFPVELTIGETYRVRMSFDAASQVLATSIFHNGQPYGELPQNTIRPLNYTEEFGDFRVDAFSIQSYSDAGQSPPQFAGSVLAHGIVDDIVITWPEAPIARLEGFWDAGKWVVLFESFKGWTYTLERTTNLESWNDVGSGNGVDGMMTLRDEIPPNEKSFYRVSASRL